MVYPHEHILIRFHGHFGTSTSFVDEWSAGVRMGFPNLAPIFDTGKLQTLVNAADAAARVFHANANALVGTNCYFDYASGAQIGVSGRYTPSSQQTILSTSTPTAGTGTPTQPYNAALVTSLRTAIPRGRGSNGRVYWPCLAPAISATTGRMLDGNVAGRLAPFKTFLDALNTAANAYSAGMKVVVASNVGGGLITPVTSIRADGRLDSIERRENATPSTWSTATLA